MIREICRMENPILRSEALQVDVKTIKSDYFSQLLLDMRDSMEHYGGIGIAAPQIGISLKVAIIELPPTNRYGEEVELGLTTFINPRIEYLNDELQGYWEGCLSVPGLRGFVERPQRVRVHYLDENGTQQVLEASGFLATVLQHELDHLEGVLYIDRIKNPKLLSYQEEYILFIENKNNLD